MSRIGVVMLLAALLGGAGMAGATEAFVYGGRTMVPLRMVGESFGASVQFDSRTKGVSISLDYRKVNMTVDSPRAHVGDRVVVLDSPAVVAGGVCYVPARFVSDTFGFGITWVSAEHRVIVVHPKTKKQIVLGVSRRVPPGLAKKGGMPPGQAKKLRNHHDGGDDSSHQGKGRGRDDAREKGKGHGKGKH
ncbi:MAG: copper amine oxidase N-terminal domain-containing protein [Armatimonadota bacterium]